MSRIAALVAACTLAAGAVADEHPHEWTLEVRLSTVYYPDADAGAGPGNSLTFEGTNGQLRQGAPFYDVYGPKHRMLTDLEVDRDLWSGFGTVALGLSAGYAEFYGQGLKLCADYNPSVGCLAQASGSGGYLQQVAVNSSFHVVPLRLLATYRFDYFVPRGIPIVPFVRGGLDWVIYWNAMQSGQISYVIGDTGNQALGLTTGIEGSAGVQVLLDQIDTEVGGDAWHELGIAHTYLMIEYVDQIVQNGPGNVIHSIRTLGATPPAPVVDLSAAYFDFGLGFQF